LKNNSGNDYVTTQNLNPVEHGDVSSTATFNCGLPSECICVFCMDLRANGDCFPKQH